MKIIYKSGQEMPENVQSAMRYISKIGFMSTAQWHRTFGTGNLRWRQKQLKSLQEKKFIRKHTSSDKGYWVLGRDGHKVLAAMKRDPVTPASALQFVHDEFVGESLVRLEMAGVCEYWLSEAELKHHGDREWLLKSRDKKIKYPDALIDVRIKDKDWKIALEYERIGKSYRRYRDLLHAYEAGNNLALIIYVVEDLCIKRRIQSVVRDLGSQYLLGRIAFADKEKWIEDPASCELEFNNGTVILRDACTLYR